MKMNRGKASLALLWGVVMLLTGCNRHIINVTVNVPTSARIKLDNIEKVVVLDFLSTEQQFDPGQETAKQLRDQLQNTLGLEVVSADETKAAIERIEQESQGTVKRKGEYFQEIGHMLAADAIFGGSILFNNKDTSGYERQEYLDERTGRTYYRDVWVERISLEVEMEAYLVRTSDGEFLFDDKFLDQTMMERESSSTSIYGFYELIENQVDKLVSHLSPQSRAENRYLLR
ncbi:hypothetical protein JXQ70_14665 [bacterium]|nr:hypothetical protein [bacterium]